MPGPVDLYNVIVFHFTFRRNAFVVKVLHGCRVQCMSGRVTSGQTLGAVSQDAGRAQEEADSACDNES